MLKIHTETFKTLNNYLKKYENVVFITFAEPLLLKQQIENMSGTGHLRTFTKSAGGSPLTVKERLLDKHDTSISIFIQSSPTTCRQAFIYSSLLQLERDFIYLEFN